MRSSIVFNWADHERLNQINLVSSSEMFWSRYAVPLDQTLTQLCKAGQTRPPIPHKPRWPKAAVYDPDHSLPSSPSDGESQVDTRSLLPLLYHICDDYSTNWQWSCLYTSTNMMRSLSSLFVCLEIDLRNCGSCATQSCPSYSVLRWQDPLMMRYWLNIV